MKEIKASFCKGFLVAIFITLLTSVSPISAAEYTVGVKAGEWIKYGEMSADWIGIGTAPEEITVWNSTEWMKLEIQSVSGTNVTAEAFSYYEDGTNTTETLVGDVATAEGNLSPEIIPAGLKKGDAIPIPISGVTFNIIINSTITRVYADASRKVNVLNLDYSDPVFTLRFTAYWDQATGVLLDFFRYQSMSGQTKQWSFKATETNMWSPDNLGLTSDNAIYIVGINVLVIVIFVGVFFAWRRKQTPNVAPM
jgi:hypothetical protein